VLEKKKSGKHGKRKKRAETEEKLGHVGTQLKRSSKMLLQLLAVLWKLAKIKGHDGKK
jgi:hypothetical protein